MKIIDFLKPLKPNKKIKFESTDDTVYFEVSRNFDGSYIFQKFPTALDPVGIAFKCEDTLEAMKPLLAKYNLAEIEVEPYKEREELKLENIRLKKTLAEVRQKLNDLERIGKQSEE